MASNSRQRSGSSDRSPRRKRVVISGGTGGAGPKDKPRPKVDPKRSSSRASSARVTAERTPARTAAGKRRDERENRLRKQRAAARIKVALVSVSVVLVGYAIFALYQSSLFLIEDVEIVGNERVSADRILEVAQVPSDATLLRFPGAAVKERLEADPWISEAVVARDFPSSMRIRVSERSPVAYVDMGTEEYWLVDPAGFVVDMETPETTGTLVVIRDLEAFEPVIGTESDNSSLLNALSVWEGLGSELRGMTRAILAPSVDKTTLVTTDDIQILIGSAEDIGKKDLIAREILDEHAGKVVYVNVRTIERPTWRSIEE